MEGDRLGHLDEHLEHPDVRHLEQKDALVHQFRLDHDQAQCQTDDLYVHLRHHLVGPLKDRLDE
jgi:hypothetical protein